MGWQSRTQRSDLACMQGACCPALKGDCSEQEDRQERADHRQARPVAQGGRHCQGSKQWAPLLLGMASKAGQGGNLKLRAKGKEEAAPGTGNGVCKGPGGDRV